MPFDALTGPFLAIPPTTTHPLTLNVRMPDGGWLAPPAEAGHSVIDVLERFGVQIRRPSPDNQVELPRARIARPWRERMLPPTASEAALLAGLPDGDASTRLLSGLVMTPELDGLEMELHPASLVPQTYWIAG